MRKKYFVDLNINDKFFVSNLFKKIEKILAKETWIMPGIISVYKDVILAFDDFNIKIKSENKIFDFEKHLIELYDAFEEIRA